MQRKIALKIIYKTISDASFTNLLMRKELQNIDPLKRAFVTNIVQGVLKNYEFLAYNVSLYAKKTDLLNRIIIMMALYERFYLDKESYAVNNSYVELAKTKYDKSFVNAILRKVDKLVLSNIPYIDNSLPEWLYKLLSKQYPEKINDILANYHAVHKTYYRLNPHKCTFKDLSKYKVEIIKDNIFICETNLLNSEEFKKGYFYIQDINAAKLTEVLDLTEDDLLLDACSAPGSKLFNCLEVVKDYNAFSNDLSETRLNLIKQRALLLGYNHVNFTNYDASILNKKLNMSFDKIILDVPCSGLGVIGRKPDIKFHIQPDNLDELQGIGYSILENCSDLLKEGGELLFSTCTLNKKENGKQIGKFLVKHNEFSILKEETIIENYGDLFYYCLLKKTR